MPRGTGLQSGAVLADHRAVRRLLDYQQVTLLFGEAAVAGTVTAVRRGDALITLQDPGLLRRVTLPRRTELRFQHAGHIVLLEGVVTAHGERGVLFMPDLRGLVPSRREDPRLSLALPARVTPEGGPAVDVQTVDLSVGGTLLASTALGVAGAALRLELTVPGEHPVLTLRGRIVRVIPTGTAVRFDLLDAADAAVLDSLVNEVRRALAERFTRRRAAQAQQRTAPERFAPLPLPTRR